MKQKIYGKNEINLDIPRKIIKNSLKQQINVKRHSKDVKVKGIMFLLKKLIRLR